MEADFGSTYRIQHASRADSGKGMKRLFCMRSAQALQAEAVMALSTVDSGCMSANYALR
jgi:hypothetical protein